MFFTVALPLIFLVLFAAIFGNDKAKVGDHLTKFASYDPPAILARRACRRTFVNLTIWLTITRERGQLKRVRAVPVPASVIIAGRTLTAAGVAAVMTVVARHRGAPLRRRAADHDVPAALITPPRRRALAVPWASPPPPSCRRRTPPRRSPT